MTEKGQTRKERRRARKDQWRAEHEQWKLAQSAERARDEEFRRLMQEASETAKEEKFKWEQPTRDRAWSETRHTIPVKLEGIIIML